MKLITKKLFFLLIIVFLTIIIGLLYIFNPPKEEPKRIRILLYQKTPTTISFLDGLRSDLAEQGYYQGKNLYLYVENLGNPAYPVKKILNKLEKQHTDLLVTTGNDLTINTARAISKKPIIFALVSDPMRDETIKAIEKERTITGISYFTPYDRTLDLSKKIIPNLKNLAVVISTGYTWPDLDKLKIAAQDFGIKITVTEAPINKIPESIIGLSGRTDAIYLPNEVSLIMHRDLIQKALLTAKLPAISNNLGFQYASALTYFADPETMGAITGKMAVKIFHGANIEFMPAELSSYFKLVINQRLLNHLKIKTNEDVLSYANEVLQ